ncbi:MAG: hypothetical protein R3C32_13440 [Chloroflexota bacterium]
MATQTWLHDTGARPGRSSKRDRQRAVQDLVSGFPITSQQELVGLLAARGFAVTRATVSRDIAGSRPGQGGTPEGHVYAKPEDLTQASADDTPLLRLACRAAHHRAALGSHAAAHHQRGMASALSQAIDESTFQYQEGTLAGENTVLVLFADEGRLERWRATFESLRGRSTAPSGPSAAHRRRHVARADPDERWAPPRTDPQDPRRG